MMMNDSTWQVLHRGDHYPRRLCTRKQYLHRVTTVRTGSWTPYALTPNTVELIPTLGALYPRGGPVQDPVLTTTPDLLQGRGWCSGTGPANAHAETTHHR